MDNNLHLRINGDSDDNKRWGFIFIFVQFLLHKKGTCNSKVMYLALVLGFENLNSSSVYLLLFDFLALGSVQ